MRGSGLSVGLSDVSLDVSRDDLAIHEALCSHTQLATDMLCFLLFASQVTEPGSAYTDC